MRDEFLAVTRLAAAPRVIPASLQVQVLLGGTASQIGWFLLGFGSIFFWVFACKTDLSGWQFRQGHVARTSGISLGCQKTGFREGDEHLPRSVVYRNLYRYAVDGQTLRGASYSLGQCVSRGSVTVEYLLLDPATSRIIGMRRRPLSPWAALAAIVPAVGLTMVLVGIFRGRGKLKLLCRGLPASGHLIQKLETNSRTMGRADFLMTFEFTTQYGLIAQTKIFTNQPEPLESEPETLVLYDPAKLSGGLLFRSLPGEVSIGRDGQPARSGP